MSERCTAAAMISFLKETHRKRCRVVRWRLTDEQALELALNMETFTEMSADDIYTSLTSGNAHMLGARVEVRR